MKLKKFEKLLYKIGILLVVVGVIIKLIGSPADYFSLYLILMGHIAGVTGILLNMKQANDTHLKNHTPEEALRQLENH